MAVGGDSPSFDPGQLSIQRGDTVTWTWAQNGFFHSVTSGKDGTPDGLFDSGTVRSPFTFSYTFNNAGTFDYYCRPHLSMGMTGQITVAEVTPRSPVLGNISTRLSVQTDDNVLIGGFIITGTQAKRLLVRTRGPSLGVAGSMADPTLELVGPSGSIATNDNWMDAPNRQEIIDSTVAPTNNLEAAILTTLPSNRTGYTAIVRGVGRTTGVASVEVYELDVTGDAALANISSRGFVQTDDNVMIGGFIISGSGTKKVLVRALGPSLPVAGGLGDPVLELFDGNGARMAMNDDWRSDQEAEIIASTVPPPNNLEAAIVVTLPPGPRTAIVRGKNRTTGVATVEVYSLN